MHLALVCAVCGEARYRSRGDVAVGTPLRPVDFVPVGEAPPPSASEPAARCHVCGSLLRIVRAPGEGAPPRPPGPAERPAPAPEPPPPLSGTEPAEPPATAPAGFAGVTLFAVNGHGEAVVGAVPTAGGLLVVTTRRVVWVGGSA